MDNTNIISVVLCDDHPILTEGLSTVIAIKYPQLKIRGIFHNGYDLLKHLNGIEFDVLLLDLKMPGLDGVAIVRKLLLKKPQTKVIILTTFDDKELIRMAMQAGASGFLLKQQPIWEIVEAVEQVFFDSPAFARKVSQYFGKESLPFTDNTAPEKLCSFSRKERLCAQLIAQGLGNNEISVQMNISEKTVRNYISNIYDKIEIHQRGEAILWLRHHLHF